MGGERWARKEMRDLMTPEVTINESIYYQLPGHDDERSFLKFLTTPAGYS